MFYRNQVCGLFSVCSFRSAEVWYDKQRCEGFAGNSEVQHNAGCRRRSSESPSWYEHADLYTYSICLYYCIWFVTNQPVFHNPSYLCFIGHFPGAWVSQSPLEFLPPLAFSALTLLVGWQEGHPAYKKTE